jgi:hypothetical protein
MDILINLAVHGPYNEIATERATEFFALAGANNYILSVKGQ